MARGLEVPPPHPEERRRGSYLTRCGVFTQQGFVIGGKDGRVIVDVQDRHQRDAFPDLDRILWERKDNRPFKSQQHFSRTP